MTTTSSLWPVMEWKEGQKALAKLLIVTPEMARDKLYTAHFSRQRHLKEANVKRLAEEMLAGRYIKWMQAYVGVLPDNSELLLNLNHSFQAIVESGIPQPILMMYVRLKDLEEAGRIYAVFDIHAQRTWADSLRSIGGESSTFSQRIASGVRMIENHMEQHTGPSSISRLDVVEQAIHKYTVPAQLYRAAIHGGLQDNAKICILSPVIAVGLLTMRDQPSLASDFWHAIAHEDGISKKDPERAMLGWFRNNRTHIEGATGRKLAVRAATLAWNARFRGESLEVVRPNAMTRFFVLGTTWDKGDPSKLLEIDADDSATELNKRMPWTDLDDNFLLEASKNRTAISVIARYLGRTPGALRQRALKLNISIGHDDAKRRDTFEQRDLATYNN